MEEQQDLKLDSLKSINALLTIATAAALEQTNCKAGSEIVSETCKFLRFILSKNKDAASVRRNLTRLLEKLNLPERTCKVLSNIWDEHIAHDYDEELLSLKWCEEALDAVEEAFIDSLVDYCRAKQSQTEKEEEYYDDDDSNGKGTSSEDFYDEKGREDEGDKEDLLSNLDDDCSFSINKTQRYSIDDPKEAVEWVKTLMDEHKDAKKLVGIVWKVDPRLSLKNQLPSLKEIQAIKKEQDEALEIPEEYRDNKILLKLVDGRKCEEEDFGFNVSQAMFDELEKAMKSDEPYQEDSIYVYLFDVNDKLREDLNLRDEDANCTSPYWLKNLTSYTNQNEEDNKEESEE